MKLPFVLEPEKLEKLAEAHREDYAHAQPFPHVVIDGFLSEEILDQVIAEFPKPEEVEWKEEFGGHLELWARDMSHSEKRVLPVFNRCVIFSTTDYSYHGHPDPLNCPEDRARKSLALYYYTNGRPPEEVSPLHTTLFQRRPGEGIGASVFSILTRLTPPILIE